jgi:ABC-2 type transport system ATP-binding protein
MKRDVMDAIFIEGLTKTFRSGWPGRPPIQALNHLSLSVAKGEIYGFLGPNGAGKTTTLKILMGLMRATGGRAEVMGRPAGDVEIRRVIGYLPESPYFYDYLTAREFLGFYGHLAGLRGSDLDRRVDRLLERVGMIPAADRQLRKFSKGMLQRVGLAQALIHDPDLVILDEPMSGLDPLGRKEVRDVILSLREQGKTVFFSSHIIPDVELICDRVGIVLKGKLVAAGRVEELLSHDANTLVEIVCEGAYGERLAGVTRVATRVLQQGSHCMIVLPGPEHVHAVLDAIRAQGGRLVSVTPHKQTLEELFILQTGMEDHSQQTACASHSAHASV